jgi:hypothetical protein
VITLHKCEKVSIVIAIIFIIILPVGVYINWWEFNAILDYILGVVISGGIVGALVWGFRKRISNAFEKVPLPAAQVHQLTKKLGSPDSINDGIQIYNRRSQLPFDEFLAEAKQQVDMLAVTFHCVTTGNIELIEETIYRGVRVMFVILNPDSRYAENRKEDFHEGEEVKHHIERSIRILCDLKRRLADEYKDNLVIRTYDNVINESIIIIDKKLIKIEKHQKGSDSGSRTNELTYNTDNQSFFQRYSHRYQKVKLVDYQCSDRSI